MAKRKWLAALAAILTLALACALFGACADKTEYTLTWRVDDGVTVSVEGAEGLPETWEEGEDLVFTVTPPSAAYEVTVRVGNRIATEEDGKYTAQITGNTAIVIRAERSPTALVVSSMPDKLTYSIGDVPDVTGLEVAVQYGDSSTEPLTADDYTVSPSEFAGGETEIFIIYKADRSLRAEIPLASPVKYTATLELNGGTLVNEEIKEMEGYTETPGENGNVTVTFAYYLDEGETLDISATRKNYKFLSWKNGTADFAGGTTLTHENQTVLTLSADWQFTVVEFAAVRLEVTTDPANAAAGERPYLILEGTFYAADSAQLYLLEGDQHISLEGTTVSGSQGEQFTLYFDLTQLAAAAEENDAVYGAWMDIRMNATVDGELQSQEIFITQDGDIEVDLSQQISYGTNAYRFQSWTNEETGRTALKVELVSIGEYTYEVSFDNSNGTPTLILTGQFDMSQHPDWVGKTLRIDWWQMSGSWGEQLITLTADGTWTARFALTSSVDLSKTYFHFTVRNENGSDYQAQKDLQLANCTNYKPTVTLDPTRYDTMTNAMVFETDTHYYYVGSGDNVTGLMFVSAAK